MRSALSAACAQQLVVVNVAALCICRRGVRHGPVWTAKRVARWRATGELPSPVMVWTPAQTATFLERAAKHPKFSLFHLLAFTGVCRGEAVGLRWVDVNLPARLIAVAQQVIRWAGKPWSLQRSPSPGACRRAPPQAGHTFRMARSTQVRITSRERTSFHPNSSIVSANCWYRK